tara:strand:+ start:8090 stop:8281 length:192 start_codon:yes stop_codon:yes gene_type:complete
MAINETKLIGCRPPCHFEGLVQVEYPIKTRCIPYRKSSPKRISFEVITFISISLFLERFPKYQ